MAQAPRLAELLKVVFIEALIAEAADKSQGEWTKTLAKDPMDEKERQRSIRVIENREAASPVVAELIRAGFPIVSIADLFNERLNYQSAVPILMAWLPKISNQDVKEDIVRALSVTWAKPDAAPLLVREFYEAEDLEGISLRWAIGNALEVVADDAVSDDLIAIAQNPEYGIARQMIVLALGETTNPRATNALLGLLNDEDVVGHAISALGKLKAADAREPISKLLKHPKSWVRTAARKALAEIDRG